MVIIHSRQTDNTTIEIIQWLRSFKKKFLRLNSIKDFEEVQEMLQNNVINAIYCNGLGMLMNKINVEDELLQTQIQEYLRKDEEIIWSYLFENKISELRQFGSFPYPQNCLNKLSVLNSAISAGFMVPDHELVFTKNRLSFLKESWGRIICKSTGDGINVNTDNIEISGQRTEEITFDEIQSFPEVFFPSLIQKLIEKKYEIRVFYFNRTTHAIAIFSQQNSTTNVDGRFTDSTKPSRRVPYILPTALEEKIEKLMNYLQLNYGSLDLIVDNNSDFIFLEVNPYGQYGFLSKAGNYYIEKEIAEYL